MLDTITSGLSTDKIFLLPLCNLSCFKVLNNDVYPPGLPVRSVLRVSSMMTKLWTSLMPAVIKGSGGDEAEDAPVSMALHLFDGMEIILALCKDLNLRIWSCQVS